MRLSVHLAWLSLEQRPLLRVLRALLKTGLPERFMGLCCVLEGVYALLQSTARAAMPPVSTLSDLYSAYSCFAVARQSRFWNILREMKRLVQAMEDTPGEKVWVDSTRAHIAVIYKGNCGVATVIFITVLVDMLLSEEPLVSLWPFVPHAGSWGLLVGRLFWGGGVVLTVASICYMSVALMFVTAAAAGLHHALTQRLLDSTATPGVGVGDVIEDVVRMHQQLRHETLDLVDFFAANLVHILAYIFVNTFLSILQVLNNEVTITTYAFPPLVVVVFFQLSYYSQELSDSSLALERSAFVAATGGAVTLSEARALHLVILAASRPPALSCRGLGRLSLANAASVLRQFYSVVNVMSSKF